MESAYIIHTNKLNDVDTGILSVCKRMYVFWEFFFLMCSSRYITISRFVAFKAVQL